MPDQSSSIVLACVAALAAAPAPALAQWTMKAEAGLVAARGNTETDSANAKLDAVWEIARWRHGMGFSGIYASDSTGATAQNWEGRAQSDYDFHPRGFAFASGRYEEDRFSGFEHQMSYGLGLGWRFYDDPITKLTAQVGVGYKIFTRREALEDDGVTVIPRMREEDVVGQGRVSFERALTETTSVREKLLVEAGADNTFVNNELSLQVKINSALALAVGYSIRYNTDPPPGFGGTDRLTTLNLVYELK